MSSLLSWFKKNHRKTGLVYLLVGFSLILIFLGYRFYKARTLSFFAKQIPQTSEERSGEIPTYIKSYPLGIDVSIKEAAISRGIWQVFDNAVSHLNSSGRIGEGKNIILYGHNKDNVFNPLRYMKEGETIIELYDDKGQKYLYKVVKTDTVEPTNLSYLQPTSEETLTLYTCTGFVDSKRFVVVAKPLKENKLTIGSSLPTPSPTFKIVPIPISTPIPTQKSTSKPSQIVSVYLTFYGWSDNDPAGTAIAFPKNESENALHNEASGVGSFTDPVTFASDPKLFAVGTKIYIAYLQKYAVMEDSCATCIKDNQKGVKHVDVWMGGNGQFEKALLACEDDWTREKVEIEINPSSGKTVNTSPLFNSGSGTCRQST